MRALGLLRSLLTYHAIPFRQRRLRALLAPFVRRDGLAFDLGAHVGNRVRAMRRLGARVVAVEPQPLFASFLRRLFPDVTVIEAAIGEHVGRAILFVSDVHSTVSTLSAPWRGQMAAQPGFAGVTWDREVDVEVITLDALIARHGAPDFVKIDIEGSEAAALRGLSYPVAALAFEYVPGALADALACVDLIERLGRYGYNWSPGETMRWGSPDWLDAQGIRAFLAGPPTRSGDIYCRLTTAPADPDGRP